MPEFSAIESRFRTVPSGNRNGSHKKRFAIEFFLSNHRFRDRELAVELANGYAGQCMLREPFRFLPVFSPREGEIRSFLTLCVK